MFKDNLAIVICNGTPLEYEDVMSVLVSQEDSSRGDYSLPCFKFAKKLGKSPMDIAKEFSLKVEPLDIVSKCEVVGGYLNIFIDQTEFVSRMICDLPNLCQDIGSSNEGEGKTICIDFSSVNIAKPFHIGHLSSTVLGASLYRIYKRLGYKVVGINHLGDYGTQFGKLIYAYKNWGNQERLTKNGISELLKLYVRFHEEAEKDDSLNDEARAYFKRIENGDEECLAMFRLFKDITLKEVGKTYSELDVYFDSYKGESFFSDKIDEVIDILNSKGLLKEDDGALIVDLKDYDMPPCLIKRSDGASLYATRDISAVLHRSREYNFDKCLYVVAYQQNLHFKQVFKVVELMGLDVADRLVHVPFGMVSLEEGTMSTRKGKVVFLQDVLNKAVEKTLSLIEEKNPDLENKLDVARMVGRGAVIYSALANSRIKDITFSYERVLSFEGETGPYLQYTYARTASVLRKAGEQSFDEVDFSLIADSASVALVKELTKLSQCVSLAGERYEPSIISKQLIDVAKAFTRFYIENKIMCDCPATKTARLFLTLLTKNALKSGLELILLRAPEQM